MFHTHRGNYQNYNSGIFLFGSRLIALLFRILSIAGILPKAVTAFIQAVKVVCQVVISEVGKVFNILYINSMISWSIHCNSSDFSMSNYFVFSMFNVMSIMMSCIAQDLHCVFPVSYVSFHDFYIISKPKLLNHWPPAPQCL